eukprot:907030-Rhodomonas_salina.1
MHTISIHLPRCTPGSERPKSIAAMPGTTTRQVRTGQGERARRESTRSVRAKQGMTDARGIRTRT